MFKRKPKKSHKNDEIYIDYSNDVDVKKVDEDEAKPEHYKALEVDDEVVVSSIQIKEAIQQKAQEEFIEQRINEAAREQEVIKKQEDSQALESESLKPETQINTSMEEELVEDKKNEVEPLEDTEIVKKTDEQKIEETNKERIDEQQVENIQPKDDIDTYVETSPQDEEDLQVEQIDDVQDQSEDEEIDTEEEDTQDHPIYSSFLHEELSVRRNLEPIKHKSNEDQQTLDDIDDTLQEIEEDSDEVIGEQIEMNEDVQEDSIQVQVSEEKKQDLHSYFQTDASVLKKGAKKQRKIEDKESLEDQRTPLYQYKHHQFYSVKEFMMFLESNYIQLDHIAHDILKDERFFRWIKEESNQFEESITKMRKFKHELKQ